MPDSVFYEEIDDLILICDPVVEPSIDELVATVRQLCSLIAKAPIPIPAYFELPKSQRVERLLNHCAFEQLFFETCKGVGFLVSRSPHGIAMATIAIPTLDIEQTFSCEKSLTLALVASIALTMIDIVERSKGISSEPN